MRRRGYDEVGTAHRRGGGGGLPSAVHPIQLRLEAAQLPPRAGAHPRLCLRLRLAGLPEEGFKVGVERVLRRLQDRPRAARRRRLRSVEDRREHRLAPGPGRGLRLRLRLDFELAEGLLLTDAADDAAGAGADPPAARSVVVPHAPSGPSPSASAGAVAAARAAGLAASLVEAGLLVLVLPLLGAAAAHAGDEVLDVRVARHLPHGAARQVLALVHRPPHYLPRDVLEPLDLRAPHTG